MLEGKRLFLFNYKINFENFIISCRAQHGGDLIPGKALMSNQCHISFNMEEIAKDIFEVLVNNANYEWHSAADGNFPANAVVGGKTSTGENLYVGRVSHNGIVTPGKIHPSHRCIYIPFGWKEHRYTHYEVLVAGRIAVCPPYNPPAHPIHPPHMPPMHFPPGPGHHRPHFPPGRGHHRGHHH
jgi:hypothetical protein